jgi:hypothetical protein
MLDIKRALGYMSADPRASEKFGLGAVASLAPILNLAAIGYQVDVARRVARGESQPLPEWNDLGRLWGQGAGLGLAYFVYALPVMILVFSGMASVFIGLVLSLQTESVRNGIDPPLPPPLVLVIFFSVLGLALAYSFFFSLLRPAILAEYVRLGTFWACFDVRALWRFIRRAPGEYLQLWLAELILSWVISLPLLVIVFIVGFIPFVGPVLIVLVAAGVSFFVLLVTGHLVGQLLAAGLPSPV